MIPHRMLAGLVIGLMVAPSAQAADSKPPQYVADQVDQAMARYNLHPSFEKLGRGVGNALLGWGEIPLGVHRRYSREDTATTFISGLAIGIVKGAVRMGVGVYETVTFLLPNHVGEKGPDPDAYGPIVEPEYLVFRRGDKP